MDHLFAEVSLARLGSNLRRMAALVGDRTRLCPVVKGEAYGHGVEQVLAALPPEVQDLAVATPAEAVDLRARGWEGSILMLLPPSALPPRDTDSLDRLAADRITITVASPEHIEALTASSRRVGVEIDVHLKVDTGMGRGGAPIDMAAPLIASLRAGEGPRLRGLYTHFATADEPDLGPTEAQLAAFLDLVRENGGGEGLELHAANSAAAIRVPEARLDLVRCGLAIYGYWPNPAMERVVELEPVLRLVTHVVQVKDVPAGFRCGYGLEYRFPRDSSVALVPAGYGDGYMRSLVGRSVVEIAGREAPVRGQISMDVLIVDVTEIPHIETGAPVTVISEHRDDPNSIESLAALAGTSPYELAVRLGPRARRVRAEF